MKDPIKILNELELYVNQQYAKLKSKGKNLKANEIGAKDAFYLVKNLIESYKNIY